MRKCLYGSGAKTGGLGHDCPGHQAYPYKHSRSGPVQTFAYFGTRFLPGNVCTGKPFGPIFGRMFVRVGLSSSRLTRTNIFWAQKHVWAWMFVRVGFSGKCLAREIHQNVCTGRVLLICVRMFVRVGCTRPVQTFRGPNIAPPPRGADPYKHSTYKHPEERARRRGAGPLLPEKMFGPRNVWPTRLCKCLYGSASKRVGDKCLYVSGVERNVCTGKPFPSLFSAWDFRKWAPPPEAAPDLAPPPKKGGAELIFRIFPPNSGPVQTFFSPPPQTTNVCTGKLWQMFGPRNGKMFVRVRLSRSPPPPVLADRLLD
jgi:hypothetical protein